MEPEDSAATPGEEPEKECHSCEVAHSDWEKMGEGAVDDAHNVGLVKAYKCGNCGDITEVAYR
jgi:hypothetical protein